ncbi:MAG: hypothetical protein NTX65_14840 [Ignavibacteriales bacterium]|nr:hypothetical protein [Ignavibacteriales bacterium]
MTSEDSISDETTLVCFRKTFSSLGLDKMLFDRFSRLLHRKQLIVGKWTIVDAALKQAQARLSSNKDKDSNFT